ncbi:uncharacterized protein EI90DRAFT_3076068 [Cantharellus anzutake]|uniref:uncharacterized protein n=1 Tax=Cantharellus anzutake TaxID=1750568 RepID=UPI001905B592|nr:uncharacterized protein EI90DRAFT_3076068 [Cantharellus anzutake]KAF8324148.1 hypothetical protein EI90DRAFT_3076068 [Cantharellus anzutake]
MHNSVKRTGPSAVALNGDIYCHIIEQLAASPFNSLLSVSLVSRDFYRFTTVIRFRVIQISPEFELHLLKRLEDNPSLLSYVRKVIIDPSYVIGEDAEEVERRILEKTLDLLPRMIYLTDLRCHIVPGMVRKRTLGEGQILSSLRRLSVNSIHTDESWRHGIPWNSLIELQFTYFSDILLDVVDQMHSLRSIKLMGRAPPLSKDHLGVKRRIAEFLREVPSALEELDLEELTGDIPVSIFARFGRSLKRLRLYNRGNVWSRSVLSPEQLDEICAGCPHLEELLIDINRDGDWPHEILDKVAQFPRIKTVTLCLEVGPSAYKCVKPYLSHYTSIELYKYIASQRTFGPLAELLVTVDPHGYRACPGFKSGQYMRTYKVVPCRRLKDAHARGLLDVRSSGIKGYQDDEGTEAFYGPVGGNTEDDNVIAALHEEHCKWLSRIQLSNRVI